MDVFDYHHKLINLLNSKNDILRFSLELREQKYIYDKIKFTLKEYEKFDILKDLKDCDPKCNKKSVEYRKIGNSHFSLKNRNYWLALEFYNKSICYAEMNSEDLSLGYGNRSAVYYELKEYDRCLENIKLARSASSKLSANLHEKLNKREENCLNNLSQLKLDLNRNIDRNEEFFPELSYPPHNKVPFIANCLEISENNNFGRCIITNQHLKVGECIAVESPFNNLTLDSRCAYSRCCCCVEENFLSLIPCKNCTGAMFCGAECYEKSFESFHKFECSSINVLNNIFFRPQRAALRVVLTLFSNIEQLEKIIAFIMENDCKKINAFNIGYTTINRTIYDEYKLIHGLETNENLRSPSDMCQRIGVAAIFFKFLKQNQYLKEIFEEDFLYENLFLKLLLHHLQTAATNYHSLDTKQIMNQHDDLTYASGVYPFLSMINHNCAPNVIRFGYKNNVMCLYVLRNISKGEQLFDNYGPHHCLMTKTDRQSKLKTQYLFDCNCSACAQNYPLYEQLSLKLNLKHIVTEEMHEKLMKNDKEYAKKTLTTCVTYLRKNDQFYPVAQVCDVQEALKVCLMILLKNLSVRAKIEAMQLEQKQ